MTKIVTAEISLSTNPSVAGRYFVDVRNGTRQMTTRTTDDVAAFLAELQTAASVHGVTIKVTDWTGEIEDDEENGCEGHESLNGADMGRSVYCDGTCN